MSTNATFLFQMETFAKLKFSQQSLHCYWLFTEFQGDLKDAIHLLWIQRTLFKLGHYYLWHLELCISHCWANDEASDLAGILPTLPYEWSANGLINEQLENQNLPLQNNQRKINQI